MYDIFVIHIPQMCSMSVLCPLCAQSSFASIDSLRVSLIRAANGPLSCPICHELFLGLDKLTIHLFSHTNILAGTTPQMENMIEEDEIKHKENSCKTFLTCTSLECASIQAPKILPPYDPVSKKISTELTTASQQQCPGSDVKPHEKETWKTLPTCDICEFNFRNQELLELHFRLVHQNDALTRAENQSQPLNSESNVGSKNFAHDFKCHLCSKTFKMKGSLRVHLKVVHLHGQAIDRNAPKLSICDRIRSHKEGSTSIAKFEVNSSQPPYLVDDANRDHKSLSLQSHDHVKQCNTTTPVCNNVLILPTASDAAPTNALIVLNSSTEPPLNELDKDITLRTSTENAKIWECDVCAKAFTTKYFLKKHKRLHTGEMPYTCEICARTFTFQQSYHKHLLYHSDEKPHICVTCGRAFKELSTLHNHERIHSGEKPFKCEVCDKSFRQRVSFLVHTRIHTGVMPYKCDVCQKSFRYKVSQRTHKCLPNNVAEESRSTETADQISECFIKAFLESTASALHDSQNSPQSAEIAGINSMEVHEENNVESKHTMDEAMLSKTIDDIVVESCNKMGIGNIGSMFSMQPSTSSSFCNTGGGVGNGAHSPSLKFQNMRLYSPETLMRQQSGEVENEVSDFSHFLLDDVGSSILK